LPVVGVGIDPDVPAVAGSSIAQGNGIVVDELCRTSAADIYAAGDVANHLHPVFGRVQVEHYKSAEKHGAAAARLMLGSAAPNDYIHYFWSDQYEHTLQSATPRTGTTSPSTGACRKASLLASTCSRGLCRLPSGSTAGVILNTIATPRWRPARASWPAHRRVRGPLVVDAVTRLVSPSAR
jgi:hypothetical protein